MGTDLLTTQISLICNSTFCDAPYTSFSGTVTVALISIIDSLGILLAKSIIPLLIFSVTKATDCTVANCSLTTMKHILPVALLVWSLPRTSTSWPLREASKSLTAVNLRAYLSSGSDWDLLSSYSPKRCAEMSLGSFLYSSWVDWVFACLAANLSCFFFSLSCLVFCFFWLASVAAESVVPWEAWSTCSCCFFCSSV